MDDRKRSRSILPWFFAVLLLSVLLRLYDLGAESLWIDEANSLRDAQVSTIAKQSKPLYFWLLFLWMHVARSEAGLRGLAVIFGVAGVVLMHVIGKDFYSRRTGLVAALIMAVSPLHINHSQEVRMYTLLTFCAMLSTYFLYKLSGKWSLKLAAGYVVAVYLMLLTHPLTLFLLPAHGLYALMHWREKRRDAIRIVLCIFLAVLLWLPWIPQVIKFQNHFMLTQSWAEKAEKVIPVHVPLLWGQYVYGEWNRLSYSDKLVLRYAHYGYAAAVTIVALAAWYIGRRRKETWLIGLWLSVPLALMMILSATLDRGWVPRYLIYTSPALFLLTAQFITAAPRKYFLVMLTALLLLPVFRLDRYYVNTNRPQWREAVRYVDSTSSEGDTIYVYKPCYRFLSSYYHPGKARYVFPGDKSIDGGISRFAANEPEHLARAVYPASGRSWLIISGVEREVYDRTMYQIGKLNLSTRHKSFFDVEVIEIERKRQSLSFK